MKVMPLFPHAISSFRLWFLLALVSSSLLGGCSSVDWMIPTPASYWDSDEAFESGKQRIDRLIASEQRKEKPSAGKKSWAEYWRWTYQLLRGGIANGRTPNSGRKMIAYIRDQRRKAGLPVFD